MLDIKRLKKCANSNTYIFESTILIINEIPSGIKDMSLEDGIKYNCKYDGIIKARLNNIVNNIQSSLKQCISDNVIEYSYDIKNGKLYSKINVNKELSDNDIDSCINILEYEYEQFDKINQENYLDEYTENSEDGGIRFLLFFNESGGYYIKLVNN